MFRHYTCRCFAKIQSSTRPCTQRGLRAWSRIAFPCFLASPCFCLLFLPFLACLCFSLLFYAFPCFSLLFLFFIALPYFSLLFSAFPFFSLRGLLSVTFPCFCLLFLVFPCFPLSFPCFSVLSLAFARRTSEANRRKTLDSHGKTSENIWKIRLAVEKFAQTLRLQMFCENQVLSTAVHPEGPARMVAHGIFRVDFFFGAWSRMVPAHVPVHAGKRSGQGFGLASISCS